MRQSTAERGRPQRPREGAALGQAGAEACAEGRRGEGLTRAMAATSAGSRHPAQPLLSLPGAVSAGGWCNSDYSICKEADSAVAAKGHRSDTGISWRPWLGEAGQPMSISRLLQLPETAVSKDSIKVYIHNAVQAVLH